MDNRICAVSVILNALLWTNVHAAGPPCSREGDFNAIDVSQQITDAFAKSLKSIGIETVIRYYDWEEETIKGKTLTAKELNILRSNGLSVAVIFQHHNDMMETFQDPERGSKDGVRSIELAKRFEQPQGTAVYFGVDGVDVKFSNMRGAKAEDTYGLSEITHYFGQVNAMFRGTGLDIGVYGSGLVCRILLERGLAKYCWLANASKWPEYKTFEESGRWALKQYLTTKPDACFGFNADLSKRNPIAGKYGQWKP